MSIPPANYVVDKQGKRIFVQLSLQDWENFVAEFKRIENMLLLKNKLKAALQQVRQIQKAELKGTNFNDFLDEL